MDQGSCSVTKCRRKARHPGGVWIYSEQGHDLHCLVRCHCLVRSRWRSRLAIWIPPFVVSPGSCLNFQEAHLLNDTTAAAPMTMDILSIQIPPRTPSWVNTLLHSRHVHRQWICNVYTTIALIRISLNMGSQRRHPNLNSDNLERVVACQCWQEFGWFISKIWLLHSAYAAT